LDRIPVVGWLFLSREAPLHGRGFWLRPLLIELVTGVGLAGLYWYEVVHLGPFPLAQGGPDPLTVHANYLSHVVLLSLMMVATFIDFDEQTIPDAITVPGAVAGLLLAGLLPMSRPLIAVPATLLRAGAPPEHLQLASPFPAPHWLGGVWGLMIGVFAYLAWWLAISPWTWTTRRGWVKAVQYLVASLVRRISLPWAGVATLGSLAIAGVWLWGGASWESLLSALIGMAFGGGLIWAVRIVGSYALGQEAMGFGDVTLMAMIGTFTGWQATLIIFFLAPFAAVLISITQWLLTGRKDIAFGPYLCLAALYTVLDWTRVWDGGARQVFELGRFLLIIVVACLPLMGIMLLAMRWLRSLHGEEDEEEEEAAPDEPSADAESS
jgi:prepilin signal peptidase PulO-like enzyme (type II secretory pathway)